jgi:hypothetical protein
MEGKHCIVYIVYAKTNLLEDFTSHV